MSLESLISEAMSGDDPVIALNLFMTPEGKYQANVGRRSHGAYKLAQSASPVKAVEAAFKAATQPVATARPAFDDFEGLLD